VCGSFGKFITGMYKETFEFEPKFKIGQLDQPDLVGRQKDIFKLARKLLMKNGNRLFTLIGLPGVGKSALARKSMQFIDERRLLQGGYIFMSVRGFKDTEVFI
jgi:nucleoside-triphosphatase THEP1